MRVFITGLQGQLGRSLAEKLSNGEGAIVVSGGDLPDWDMTDPEQVDKVFADFNPDVVIHSAALTNVDYCAENPAEAVRVNGFGTYNVAVAGAVAGALMVAISTNEVFDGLVNRPYLEYDRRNPANPYGYSKWVAEQVVERFAGHYMIVRTSWLYAPGGANFIHKILTRARSGEPLRVVTNEVGSPTYVNDLARAVIELIRTNRQGVYHLVNEGGCSRYDFARAILELADLDIPIEPITSDAFERASSPPPYAPLDNVFAAALGVKMRPWQEALAEYIREYEQV
nr:dTDP-4-dehydrorhamnose reductase [Anaerolineae bacterium]